MIDDDFRLKSDSEDNDAMDALLNGVPDIEGDLSFEQELVRYFNEFAEVVGRSGNIINKSELAARAMGRCKQDRVPIDIDKAEAAYCKKVLDNYMHAERSKYFKQRNQLGLFPEEALNVYIAVGRGEVNLLKYCNHQQLQYHKEKQKENISRASEALEYFDEGVESCDSIMILDETVLYGQAWNILMGKAKKH